MIYFQATFWALDALIIEQTLKYLFRKTKWYMLLILEFSNFLLCNMNTYMLFPVWTQFCFVQVPLRDALSWFEVDSQKQDAHLKKNYSIYHGEIKDFDVLLLKSVNCVLVMERELIFVYIGFSEL